MGKVDLLVNYVNSGVCDAEPGRGSDQSLGIWFVFLWSWMHTLGVCVHKAMRGEPCGLVPSITHMEWEGTEKELCSDISAVPIMLYVLPPLKTSFS